MKPTFRIPLFLAGSWLLASCSQTVSKPPDPGGTGDVETAAFLDYSPSWSPDGTRIAFTSERTGNADIFVIDVDGGGLTQLTFGEGSDSTPAWSPDGSRIAICSDRGGSEDIHVIDADGSNWVRLTDHPARDCNPAWSPDGTRIAFMTNRHGDWRGDDDANWEIYVMDAHGANETRLTNTVGYELITGQAFSPDGETLVFCSTLDRKFVPGPNRFDDFDLYLMAADGSNIRQLTFDEGQDSYAYWSPDGSRISYTRVEKEAPRLVYGPNNEIRGQNYEIYVIRPDGTGITQLTDNPHFDFEGWWSPDGRKMVYTSNSPPPHGIHLMDADGANKSRLTNPP